MTSSRCLQPRATSAEIDEAVVVVGFAATLSGLGRAPVSPDRVKRVTPDAHNGLVAAIGATLPGAAWQRCRTHYAAKP